MKTSTFALRSLVALVFLLMLSTEMNAQNNRGRRYNSYYAPRPRVSVGIGYHPYFHYRPVNRSRMYYRPTYRLPYRYVHYGPAFGIRINVLPVGYNRFFIGNDPFYYANGIYYRPYKNGGYQVTQPPLGALVKKLPPGSKLKVIDGQKYYELGGTFYQESVNADNKLCYEVVGTDGVLNTTNADIEEEEEETNAPATSYTQPDDNTGATINSANNISQLPPGCSTVMINQQKYYLSPAGVYYQEMAAGNSISYKVAGGVAAPAQ